MRRSLFAKEICIVLIVKLLLLFGVWHLCFSTSKNKLVDKESKKENFLSQKLLSVLSKEFSMEDFEEFSMKNFKETSSLTSAKNFKTSTGNTHV